MLNQGAVIESLAQGHAASDHGADMWINAGTFTLDLYARPPGHPGVELER